MNRQMWTACALVLVGGLIWFGLDWLDDELGHGPPPPVTDGGESESRPELFGDGPYPLTGSKELVPHILTGLTVDMQGAIVDDALVAAHSRELPFSLPVDRSLDQLDFDLLFRCPSGDSRRGLGGSDPLGRFGVGGLPAGENLSLFGGRANPARALLAPGVHYDGSSGEVGTVVLAPAVWVTLHPAAPHGSVVSAFAQRSAPFRGQPLHWYAPPFDPRKVNRIKAPPGPIQVWVHQRGQRHDLHTVVVSADQPTHTLPVIDSDTRITLRVRDGAGEPIRGAQAALWSGPKANLQSAPASILIARAMADGRVELNDIVPGYVNQVHIRAEGFARGTLRLARYVLPGEHLQFDVTLRPGAAVSGIVLGPADTPVPGAVVVLGRGRRTLTDAAGRFIFQDVAPGRTTLRAEARGFLQGDRQGHGIVVQAEAADNVHQIKLQRGVAIQGRVYWPDGSPAAYARVHPHAPGHEADPLEVGPFDVRADQEGRFALSGIAPGRAWTVSAVLDDSVSEPLPPWIPHLDEQLPELRLDLRPAGVIAGHVRDSAGEPVEAQTVRLMPFSRYQRVGADGSFRFGSLPPGRYVVLLEKRRQMIDDFDLEDGGKTRHEIEIEVGTQVTDLVLTAPARAVLEGLLVDKDGNPVPGARVEIHDKERAWLHANPGGMFLVGDHGDTVTTDGAGRFRLAGLWGGELDYVIRVDGIVAGEKYRVPTRGLRIVKPEPVGRTVVVKFRTPSGDSPQRGSFTWLLLTKDEDAWNGFEQVERGRTTPLRNGDAKLVLPTEGDHLQIDADVWRMADGSLAPWRPVERVQLPLKGDTLTIELERGGTLSGLVVDTNGRPLPYARVELAYENGWGEYGRVTRVTRVSRVSREAGKPERFSFPSKGDVSVRTDAAGRFRFVGLRDERCYLRAVGVAGKRGGDLVQASPGATDVEIRVHDAASIRGRVLDSDGRPVAMIKVGTSKHAWRGTVTTDATGAFEVVDLEPGSAHTLYVHADDGPALPYLPHKEEDVEAGGPPMTIRLSRGVFLEGVVVDQAGASVLEGIVTAQRVGEPPDDAAPSASVTREGNRFQLGPLAPGEYDLTIGSGWNQDIKVFRTAPLRVTAPARAIRLEVHRCWELSGRVEGGKGYYWKVHWCPAEPITLPGDDKGMMTRNAGDRRRTYLSSDGTFSFDSVRERQGDLYVFGPGDDYALLRDVTIDSGQLEIQLERGFSIGGRVEGAGKGRDLRLRQGGIERTFETGEGGAFLVRGLPPGTWILEEYHKWPHIVVGPKREALPPIEVEAGNTEVVYGTK